MIDRGWRDGLLEKKSDMKGSPIDQKVLDNLRELQREGVPSILRKVITTYLGNSPKLLETLRAGLASGDTATIRFAVHSLSSSSATLGAVRLSTFCRDLETMCCANSLEFAEEMVLKIVAEYEAVQDVLQVELQRCAP